MRHRAYPPDTLPAVVTSRPGQSHRVVHGLPFTAKWAIGVSQGQAVAVHREADAGALHLNALEVGAGAGDAVVRPSQSELMPRPQLAVALQLAHVERPHIVEGALAALRAAVESAHTWFPEKIFTEIIKQKIPVL